MEKAELRKIYLEKRKALPPDEREASSRSIADNFFDKADLTKVRFLHCFLPIEKFGEVDTTIILHRVWHGFPEIKTAVPRMDRETGELESLSYSESDELRANSWEIREPAHDETVEPALIDLVLVPLLCFDRSGHRVGYGKGYYDRFLARCRPDCLKIGLSFFPPVDEIPDAHEGDVRLNFCVTPDHLYAMQGSNGKQERLPNDPA
jgi:5-formyltetrahydrofolate cyclo-ligase